MIFFNIERDLLNTYGISAMVNHKPTLTPTNLPIFYPVCGSKDEKVKRITLESLLTPDASFRIGEGRYRFCDAIDCDTVCFGDDGAIFSKSDLAVLWVVTVVVIAASAFPRYSGCLIPENEPGRIAIPANHMTTAFLGIEGTTRESCAVHVRSGLANVSGVLDASVSCENGTAAISFDASPCITAGDIRRSWAASSRIGLTTETAREKPFALRNKLNIARTGRSHRTGNPGFRRL